MSFFTDLKIAAYGLESVLTLSRYGIGMFNADQFGCILISSSGFIGVRSALPLRLNYFTFVGKY